MPKYCGPNLMPLDVAFWKRRLGVQPIQALMIRSLCAFTVKLEAFVVLRFILKAHSVVNVPREPLWKKMVLVSVPKWPNRLTN